MDLRRRSHSSFESSFYFVSEEARSRAEEGKEGVGGTQSWIYGEEVIRHSKVVFIL